jgi:hypothetical protein
MSTLHPHRPTRSALLLGSLVALALALSACAAAEDDALTLDESTAALEAPWRFVGTDLSPAPGYSFSDDGVNVSFSGYYSWDGTWATGYKGLVFARPADLVAGGTYALTLTTSDISVGIPVYLRASLSGAGADQSHLFFGAGSTTLTFTVSSDPGRAPELFVTAHPALGHIGPLDHLGILIQSYRFTAQLVRID